MSRAKSCRAPSRRCRHNMRTLDTLEQMKEMVRGMEGKRLWYCDLVDSRHLVFWPFRDV